MFYDNLCRLCEGRGLTVTKLVTNLSLSSGNLSKWKNGGVPRANTLQKIAEYLKVSADALLSDFPEEKKADSIRYALYHETADVSEDTLKQILAFARFAKKQEKEKDGR